ncbi:hypothetical protein MMC12_006306 [Toensbergia leucococca]|nr:hypothetical protein [Toensbergia leucococca]
MAGILSNLLAPPFSDHTFRRWWSRKDHSRTSSTDPQPDDQRSKRIYILGTGNVGTFVAYSLAELKPRPPITLLCHRKGLLDVWKAKGEEIELSADGTSDVRGGFDVELATAETEGLVRPLELPHETISHLIVAVKTPNTVSALDAIKHRLTPKCTLLFLQNGMGVSDEVNETIFRDPGTRPHYMLGIISHGINSTKPFAITHAGIGTISLSSTSLGDQPASALYLQTAFLQAKSLNAHVCSRQEMIKLQWEKLVVNAIINPLTAIMDVPNGRILEKDMTSTVRLLIAEISRIIQALPDMSRDMKKHFLPDRLETLVINMATKTANNISSMLQDIRAKKPTEIEYINGYIVRRAEELGVSCEQNRKLMRQVLTKQQLR